MKIIEQAAEDTYGSENDPVNVRKKVAFVIGATWMKRQQESKIDSHIKWCEEKIKEYYHPSEPVENKKYAEPYQQFIRLLKQLK